LLDLHRQRSFKLRDYIYKEGMILFPMVARFLSPERDAQLLQQMKVITKRKALPCPPTNSGQSTHQTS